jgi:hypothetical protein
MRHDDPKATRPLGEIGLIPTDVKRQTPGHDLNAGRGAQVRDLIRALLRWLRMEAMRPAPVPRAQLIEGLKAAVAPFVVSRTLVVAATLFGARYVPVPPGLYSALYPPTALAPFFHWDADAYGYIAQHGYALGSGGVAAEVLRVAWFPFYPLLIRLAGGSNWAMIIIPNVCFFAALALMYVIGVKHFDPDRARLTLWIVALGPAAMFFSYPYTESVFLLVTVVAFVLMESGHWLWAGVAGLAASLTRVPGILVGAALGAEAVLGRRRTAFIAIALPIAGLVAVSLIDWAQMGDPLGFVHAQAHWIGPNRNPFYLIGSFPRSVLEGDPFRPEGIGFPVFIAFAVGALWVARRMPASYGIFALLQVLVALKQGLYLQYFSPVPRYVSVIFPCYFAFATLLAPRKSLQLTWLLISASVMVVNAALYGGWRSIS